MSNARQNYHEESEAAVNKQINVSLWASYTYISMSSHFDRDDIALPGFSSFFFDSYNKKHEQAQSLMQLQNKRGGRLVLADVKKPESDEWGDGETAMKQALSLEKRLNETFLDLHTVVTKHNDAELEDHIEHNYLKPQVELIKKLSDYIRQLTLVGPGLGEFLFDKETLQE